ncbi:MAG: hypothetical protein K2Z80_07005 [Xanthobacteraceae bacterium]|nr:hypothetical protein [Xanthobacteraceae bacterium]
MRTHQPIHVMPGHSRPKDGVASPAYGRPKDGVASLAYSRPKDGVASLAYSRPKDGVASLAYSRPKDGVASLAYVPAISIGWHGASPSEMRGTTSPRVTAEMASQTQLEANLAPPHVHRSSL